jgi:hypothetical protein
MPFETSWCLPNKVIYVKATGAIQDIELEALDDEINQMLDSATADTVHFLYDPSEQTSPPRLQALGAMTSPRHPRYGWFVMCADQNKAINLAGTYYSSNANLRNRFFSNMEDTLAFLCEIDREVAGMLNTAAWFHR